MTKEQVGPSFKVVVTGDRDTGKTSLVIRLTKGALDPEFKNKSIINVHCLPIQLKDNLKSKKNKKNKKDNTVQLCIWDLAGGQEYRVMTRSAYHDASGIFLVYDISNRATFEHCVGWLKDIRSSGGSQLKVMLIGNKCDLIGERTVITEEAQAFASENGLLFHETSALIGDHIISAFQQMATCLFYSKPQQEPFQVVLIDIKKAAHDKIIRCVKRPLLEETNLKYVAISYRWGETQEATVDTQVGYLASITSFKLQDFYGVCKALTEDPDTSSIEYVWVDAICVNQTNYQQRKATIQHMTDIYERATWILAVPDLHAAYLWGNNTNADTMSFISENKHYIYYLLHGNIGPLEKYDSLFLDSIKCPNDKSFRQLLTRYTDCFAVSFLELQKHHRYFYPMDILNHLYDNIYHHPPAFDLAQPAQVDDQLLSSWIYSFESSYNADAALVENEVQSLHQCHDATHCPLKYIPVVTNETSRRIALFPDYDQKREPPQQLIYQRGVAIRESVHFLAELVKDWSTRVWVISEFHIAKRKHNLKLWFTQLIPEPQDDPTTVITFYNLDLTDPKFDAILAAPRKKEYVYATGLDVVYLTFYKKCIGQLNGRTFFEMMLQSNATKNEDRFYAIFPQFAEYKHLLTNHENEDLVKDWEITSILSVKLKLYELMTTNDKLNLLYLSHLGEATHTLPTFATSSIPWDRAFYYDRGMDVKMTVTLLKKAVYNDGNHDHGPPPYYLNLKTGYFEIASRGSFTEDPTDICSWDHFLAPHLKKALYSRLNFNDDGVPIDVVQIMDDIKSRARLCCLVGSFYRNIWVLGNSAIADISGINWEACWNENNYFTFNIY